MKAAILLVVVCAQAVLVVAACALAVSGCSVSLLGDASDNCERINRAVGAYFGRCRYTFAGRLNDCSAPISDLTEDDADTCVRELEALSCGDRPAVPRSCYFGVFPPW